MKNTSRQLRAVETLNAADAAKRTIQQSGLSTKEMSEWAELNVIRLLNGKPSKASQRVTSFIEACQRVIALHESLRRPLYPEQFAFTPQMKAQLEETASVINELNARLSEYKWLPVVRYLASPSRCFDVRFEILASNKGVTPECHAVSFVLENIHAANRIRRCHRLECRKWFFAVTEHQKYCGDDCRKRDAQQGESFKEKRRLYMKRHRREQAELDAIAKRQAKGQSK